MHRNTGEGCSSPPAPPPWRSPSRSERSARQRGHPLLRRLQRRQLHRLVQVRRRLDRRHRRLAARCQQANIGSELARNFAGDTSWTNYTVQARVKPTVVQRLQPARRHRAALQQRHQDVPARADQRQPGRAAGGQRQLDHRARSASLTVAHRHLVHAAHHGQRHRRISGYGQRRVGRLRLQQRVRRRPDRAGDRRTPAPASTTSACDTVGSSRRPRNPTTPPTNPHAPPPHNPTTPPTNPPPQRERPGRLGHPERRHHRRRQRRRTTTVTSASALTSAIAAHQRRGHPGLRHDLLLRHAAGRGRTRPSSATPAPRSPAAASPSTATATSSSATSTSATGTTTRSTSRRRRTNVWVDHNSFTNGYDGAVDIKRGSDFVTVSWNRIFGHDKSMLLGHTDDNASQDVGHLRVTYHHNWFDGSGTRHPRVRFGNPVHVYNNYYFNNEYGVASTDERRRAGRGQLLRERRRARPLVGVRRLRTRARWCSATTRSSAPARRQSAGGSVAASRTRTRWTARQRQVHRDRRRRRRPHLRLALLSSLYPRRSCPRYSRRSWPYRGGLTFTCPDLRTARRESP